MLLLFYTPYKPLQDTLGRLNLLQPSLAVAAELPIHLGS
jgi:hypothetical protein